VLQPGCSLWRVANGASPWGRICVLADGNLEPLTLTPAFHAKELAVVGSSDGLDYQQYALWFWERLREGIAPLERLFELHVDAETLPQRFEEMARGQVAPVKVFVRYDVTQKEGNICHASDQAMCARSYLV
jgi:alcohol dehydrogenase